MVQRACSLTKGKTEDKGFEIQDLVKKRNLMEHGIHGKDPVQNKLQRKIGSKIFQAECWQSLLGNLH